MPRLRLGDASRARLVSWLATLGAPDSLTQATSLQEPAAGDAYRGNPAGIGGDVSPALDRLGWKVSHSWLVAALSDSATQGLSPESHPYVLSVRDATDLSPFLVRRFSPPGAPLRM